MRWTVATLGVCGAMAAFTAGASAQRGAAPVMSLRSATSADLAAGKKIFDAQCAWCHGTNGTGGTGPILQRANLRHASTDRALVEIVRTGIPGTEMPSFAIALTERTAWQTAAYVRSLGRTAQTPVRGDARRGGTVYQSAGCASCHTIDGRGGTLGPELTAIGALRGPSHLRESIVNPKATHPPGYLVVNAVTKAGEAIRGVRLNEDVFWVSIRDAAGTVHTVQKSDLTRLDRELDGTLMPSYDTRLSPADLDDLIAYLSTLRGTS
jgi:putative heme-binding domain-containing protein